MFAVASLQVVLGTRSVAVERCLCLQRLYCSLCPELFSAEEPGITAQLLITTISSLCFLFQLQSEVEKPLLNFRENFKKDMKKCDHHIADLRKQLASRYAAVEKVGIETGKFIR